MKITKAMLRQMAEECLATVKETGADLAEICEDYASCGDDVNADDLY